MRNSDIRHQYAKVLIAEQGTANRAFRVAVFLLCLLTLALTGVASPAPQGVGVLELALIACVAAFAGMVLLGIHSGRHSLSSATASMLAAWCGYYGSFVASLLIGVMSGASYIAAFRSVIPYVIFAPIFLVGLFTPSEVSIRSAGRALLIVGSAHAIYLLTLFLSGVSQILDVQAVMMQRTTLLDTRTTLPLFFAATTLPMTWFLTTSGRLKRSFGAAIIALAAGAALSTQTRSQVLAILIGFSFFIFVGSFWLAAHRREPRSSAIRHLVSSAIIGIALLSAIVAFVAPVRVLASTLIVRSEESMDNGRVTEEWVPAVKKVVDGGIDCILLGIGAGQSFVTSAGDERTYAHNLTVYSLLYNGAVGVVLVAFCYIFTIAVLVRLAFVTDDPRYLGFASLVLSLYAYGQFFAVHKLFSYNLMLALCAQVALSARPSSRRR